MPRQDCPFRIGDTVTSGQPNWDGTVVDIIEPSGLDSFVRVYWRYPLGRVSDHHAGALTRRV